MDVLAHGLGGRSDLPIPLWLAVYGATAAVLISFYVLARLWRQPKFQGPPGGRALPSWLRAIADSRGTRLGLRVLGVLLFTGLVTVAWVGPDDSYVNPAPTWLYVWWWAGLVPASLLLGPVARLLSPMRATTDLLRRLVRRDRSNDALIARLGWWPAVGSLAAFLWLELASGFADSPRVVATFLSAYAILHVIVGVVVGPSWFDRGEGFEAYSSLFAALAPLGRRADGQLALRNPFDGLPRLSASSGSVVPGLVAFCCLVLGSTAFDGLTRTALWRTLSQSAGGRTLSLLLGSAGLVASVLLVTGLFLLAARLTAPYLPGQQNPGKDSVATAFVHSLVPVALGYTVAHYFSFVVFQGQAGWLLGSDPLDRGWDLLGVGGSAAIDYTVVTPAVIALVQVGAIVAGHIGGVVAAHDRAVELLPRPQLTAGQYPMLATMVGFTSLGIALLAGS